MIDLQEAQAIVAEYMERTGASWHGENRVEDRDGYWFFSTGFIGSIGVVVDKHDGRLTALGSAWTLEYWFWAYENGFLVENPVVRVTAVRDMDDTVEFLLFIAVDGPARTPNPNPKRAWIRERLMTLPAEFRTCKLGLKADAFREVLRDGSFTYEIASEIESAR